MTENQKRIIKDEFGLMFFPYKFMDAIENHSSYKFTEDEKKSVSSLGKFWYYINNKEPFLVEDNKMTIIQPKGAKDGTLVIIQDGISSIDIKFKKGKKNIKLEKSIFKGYMVGVIEFDFNNLIEEIKVNFLFDLAEPLIIKVNTTLYKEPEIDYTKKYLETINDVVYYGIDFVNIHFDLATSDVDLVKVELYISDRSTDRLMTTFIVEKNKNYLTIDRLAFAHYKYKIIQYIDDVELVRTDFKEFKLFEPDYSSSNVIVGY